MLSEGAVTHLTLLFPSEEAPRVCERSAEDSAETVDPSKPSRGRKRSAEDSAETVDPSVQV